MLQIPELELQNADQYKYDIDNIYMADIGDLRILHSNQFFQEACQLIINAINLYKLGYFDAAFYSLRQSIEVSIGIIYINTNEDLLKAWNKLEDGFESGTMTEYLRKNEPVFKDVRNKMKSYFDNLFEERRKIDKYVHKQGFKTFYTTYSRVSTKNTTEKYRETIKRDFIKMLEITIGAIAIYRLFIDPLPILLMEEEIVYRTPDFTAEAYSENFVNKYIGDKNLELYKTTKIYQDYKEELIKGEKQNQAVFDVIHYQYFDTKALGDIFNQIHLLSLQDKIAYFVYALSNKIAYVIVDGWYEYFSDVKLNQVESSFGDDIYNDLFAVNDFNSEYKEYYISRIKVNDKYTIIKHTDKFDSEETYNLMLIANVLTDKIKEEERVFLEQIKTIKS